MELTGLQTQPQTTTLQGAGGEAVAQESTLSASFVSQAVLSGEGVNVRSSTDFEKLLAEMETKRDKALVKSFESQFSAALTVLVGRHEGLGVAQQAAIDKVSSATTAVSQATKDVSQAQSAYDASMVALAVETAKLEAMVEAAVTTPEDRAEEIEREEREEERPETIRYTEEEIRAQKEAVTRQQQVVDANLTALNAAKDRQVQAEAELNKAVASLDSLCKGIVVEAAVVSCRLISAACAERKDGKNETHVSEIIKAIGEYADKIQEMQDEELEEAIAKISPDLVFLATADYTLAPGEFPQYENRV